MSEELIADYLRRKAKSVEPEFDIVEAHRLNEVADALETQAAEIERLREALREMFEAVCGETGFAQAVRAESGFAYPWPALDIAEAMARAALGETK